MKVKVTNKLIKKGKARGTCPILLAVKEKMHCPVYVSYDNIEYTRRRDGVVSTHLFVLPPVASKFTRNFDAGKKVKPFSFEVTADRVVRSD